MDWVGMRMDQGWNKSPSVPLCKRGTIAKCLQQVPPFNKGGISNQKGYTLVEVLVALGILGFGLLAVATMQVTAIKVNARASALSQGVTLAQSKVEELMNLPDDHDDLKDQSPFNGTNQDLFPTTADGEGDGVDDDGDNFGLDDTTGADGSESNGRYSIYWNVAIDEPVTASKTIRVSVTWIERGKNKRVSLDFVKTNLS